MHIFLFGGTTEGRKIAEAIVEVNRAWAAHESSGLPIAAEVYVTTAYGASLLPAGPGITVHVGRLDAEEMTALFMEARQATGFTSDETARQQLTESWRNPNRRNQQGNAGRLNDVSYPLRCW